MPGALATPPRFGSVLRDRTQGYVRVCPGSHRGEPMSWPMDEAERALAILRRYEAVLTGHGLDFGTPAHTGPCHPSCPRYWAPPPYLAEASEARADVPTGPVKELTFAFAE